MVKPIPDGYPVVTPFLIVEGGAKAIEFYTSVFGAKERMRFDGEGGAVEHAELQFGDSVVMLADANPKWGTRSPKQVGGVSSGLSLYVEDVDTVFKRALEHGAKEERPVEDQFYGDRAGTLIDPFGHKWTVMTHVRDVSEEEMKAAMPKG